MHNFINDKEIWDIIEASKKVDKVEIRDILQKAEEGNGLNLRDISPLLYIQDKDLEDELFDLAKRIKEKIYGNRIVIFVPLYLSNE